MATMFEYAVIVNEKRDKDGEVLEEAAVVVPVTAIVARDEGQAQMLNLSDANYVSAASLVSK